MKTNSFSIMLIMSAMLLIASCSSSHGQHGKGNICESEWGLVSVRAKSADSLRIAQSGNSATLRVMSDGTVKGTTACNSYEGQVAIDGYSLKFGNVICTQPTCANPTLTTAFYSMLSQADNYTVDHGDLLLKRGDKVLAKFMSLSMR